MIVIAIIGIFLTALWDFLIEPFKSDGDDTSVPQTPQETPKVSAPPYLERCEFSSTIPIYRQEEICWPVLRYVDVKMGSIGLFVIDEVDHHLQAGWHDLNADYAFKVEGGTTASRKHLLKLFAHQPKHIWEDDPKSQTTTAYLND